MEGERGAGPSPDTHGRIGGGRRVGKKRKTQEVALHQYLSLKKRIRATDFGKVSVGRESDRTGTFQTNLKVHKRVSVCLVSRLSGANDNKETGEA